MKTIEININTRHLKKILVKMEQAAETLGINYHKMLSVFKDTVYKTYLRCALSRCHVSAIRQANIVLGHSYMIYDEYLSMGLIQKLKNKGLVFPPPQTLTIY